MEWETAEDRERHSWEEAVRDAKRRKDWDYLRELLRDKDYGQESE